MDRIRAVLSKQDRVAVFPIVGMDHAARLSNLDFAEVAHDGVKIAHCVEHAFKTYQYDMALIFVDAYVEAEAMGCKVGFSPDARLLSPAPAYSGAASKPEDRPTTIGDRTGEVIKAAAILKAQVDVPVFVSIKGPFTLAAFLTGLDDFLKLLIRDPGRAYEIIDDALGFQLSYLERLLAVGVDIFVGDPVASGSVISPKTFQQLARPVLRTLMERIKGRGQIGGIHICGETRSIADPLDECGADILSVEDITIPTKTLKMGGVSTETVLHRGRAAIEEEVRAAQRQDRLILATSCDVPVETPAANIKAMVEFARSPKPDDSTR